jgi:5-methyltetrahydropteroyltriglutamate--homocysteine methyltransferase
VEAYLRAAQGYANVPVKQAVIAQPALSLFTRRVSCQGTPEAFLKDLTNEADICGFLDAGAHVGRVDSTEAGWASN